MEQIQEYTNNGKWIAITTLIWNDAFKQLILSCMNEPGFIIKFANPGNYCIYWIKLTKFMGDYLNGFNLIFTICSFSPQFWVLRRAFSHYLDHIVPLHLHHLAV